MTATTTRPESRTRRGAVAVELALLLPLLALLFAAVADFARVFHTTQALQNAAHVGALTASGTTWTPGYPATAADAAAVAAVAECPTLDPALTNENVSVSFAGGMTTVTVRYDFPLVTAAFSPSATVRLQRTATVRVAPRPGD